MKNVKFYLLLSLALLFLHAEAQKRDDTPYMTKDFAENNLSNLRVQTSGGSIQVEGTRNSGVRVEMYIRGNSWNGNDISDEELKERLDDYELVVRREGTTVVAMARPKDSNGMNWKKGLSISFKVFTPRSMTTDLKTSGGSIRMASLEGEHSFKTSGGSIKIKDMKGKMQGRTSGGSIEAYDCSDEVDLITSGGSIKAGSMIGNIRLVTSGGSITLGQMDGNVVAATSGGSIKGDDITGELDAKTSGGSIRLTKMAASVKARTSAGSIDADFDSLGKYLSLSTSAGSVNVSMPLNKGMDLDLRGNKVSIPLRNFNGTSEKNRVQGSMNGGGISVQLSASSGSVNVNQ
ncbi:DUF4097 family beta strand repeat-containing protein [Arundinibacter roseus]|uniref:DUF4097 domain-containing protein n=1 Tax=Arundinibacter roseus TaxID=2070510 RepID=A0A4R4K8U8_9BACT|nr:DUF4097 family beta strand repeat-containing protein [Arundinibacter roseus]TDB64164.1 hypothetical protein EZE20_14595 [Arundinibacter roseus]